RPAVPSAHVVAGRGQSCGLAEGLEHGVFIQREKERQVRAKLFEHRSIEQLHVGIVELAELLGSWVQRTGGLAECVTAEKRRAGGGAAGLQKRSAGKSSGHGPSGDALQTVCARQRIRIGRER